MLPLVLFWQAQTLAESGPSVSTVAVTFAGICALALIRVTVQNRDELRVMKQALFGVEGEREPTGLLHRVVQIALQLTNHCEDEREFWVEVKNQRETIRQEVVAAATKVTAEAQMQFADQLDKIELEVKRLAERRQGSR